MECYEKGIITKKDTNGIELKFGNADAFTEIIRKIVFREGFGHILAEGTRRAAHIIGGGSEKYAIQVKGLELGMHDPRAFQAMALTYACSPTGGRHMEGETIFMEETTGSWYPELELEGLDRLSTERKAEAAVKVQNLWMALSAAGYCLLACATGTTKPYTISINLKLLNLVTGIKRSLKDFMKTGERIFNIRKAFAIRHGATRAEDKLPERLIKEPIKNGPSKGSRAKLDEMLPKYYELRRWDPKSSKQYKEKLIDLELKNLIKNLY